MPTLDWIGKSAVVNHHLEVPYHLLKCDNELSVGDPGSGNLLIQGDNLLALKALLPYYAGKVKCIYIDPPYNTGNEGWVYNDNVNSPEIRRWLGEVVGREAEDLSRHDKWLCMMYPRIKLLRHFLAPNGVIFVSIDDNEVQHLRMLMNEVFGERNLVTMIPWQSRTSLQNDTDVSVQHEYVLAYALNRRQEHRRLKLTNEHVWYDLPSFAAYPASVQSDRYANPDNDPRGPWKADPFDAPNIRENLTYPIVNPNNKRKFFPPKGRHWRTEEGKYIELLHDNRIVFGKTGNTKPQLKVFLNEKDRFGEVPATWFEGESHGTATEGTKDLQSIFGPESPFPYPKPKRLIEALLALATRGGDIVMDSFAGSGTTAHAVLSMNQADGGSRRFILIQQPHDTSNDEKEQINICEQITAVRIRRVIDGHPDLSRNKNEHVPGLGGGFRFCRLGEPMFDSFGRLAGEVTFTDLAHHVWFLETGEPLPKNRTSGKRSPLLGVHHGTAICLLYNGVLGDKSVGGGNVLARQTLARLPEHDGPVVVYGESCRLGKNTLLREGISFRHIPYDVRKT